MLIDPEVVEMVVLGRFPFKAVAFWLSDQLSLSHRGKVATLLGQLGKLPIQGGKSPTHMSRRPSYENKGPTEI